MLKLRYWLILLIAAYVYGSALIDNKHEGQYIWSDAEGYFLYLPAVFIHHRFENIPIRTPGQFANYPGTKKPWIPYTYGVALMESPFFLMAYVSRWVQKLPLDNPVANDYSVGLLLAGCFYLTLGLYYLHRTLLRSFRPKAVWFTLAILLFGTNLLHYAIRQPGMSHIYSFCLVSILLYYLPDFYKKPSITNTLRVAIPFCLITLIRPTNILFFSFIFFFDTYNREDIANRFRWYIRNIRSVLWFPIIGVALAIPQMCYWYYLSGSPIFYSYSGGSGSFIYLASPKIYNIFFHLCNGFLIYSPLMLLALIGMAATAIKNQLNGRAIFALFAVIAYLCASWQFWWFGGAYGYRSFIDFYPILAIGLAYYCSQLLLPRHRLAFYLHIPIIAFLILLNMRMDSIRYYYQVEPDNTYSERYFSAIRKSLWME